MVECLKDSLSQEMPISAPHQPAQATLDGKIQNPTGTGTVVRSIPRWKRILDVTMVLLAIPCIVPIGILIFIFIKTVSPGPAFFRQRRVGYMRRLFICLKFRTMKINADSGAHRAHLARLMTANLPTQKLDCGGDDRLIPGGKWLR